MAYLPVRKPPVQIDARGTLSTAGFNRNGEPRSAPLELGVLHSTESGDIPGTQDISGVIQWWKNSKSGGSAHLVVDKEGYTGMAGDLSYRMPHVGHFNYNSIGIEQVGFARFTLPLWYPLRDKQLRKVAKWMAYINKKYGLPLQEARIASNGEVLTPGWTTHAAITALGFGVGGHTDPGKFYPFKRVLNYARWYAANGWPEEV